MLEKCPDHPLVIIAGDYRDPVQAVLVFENETIYDISTDTIPISLLSFYYVYNLCYPKGCSNFYTFMEAGVFNLDLKNMPTSVANFLTRINAL